MSLQQIKWYQISPILDNALQIRLEKQKVQSNGNVTIDTDKWAIDSITQTFLPNGDKGSKMTLGNVVTDQALKKNEEIDLTLALFFWNLEQKTITMQVSKVEQNVDTGVDETNTYRYVFSFYGKQDISTNSLLRLSSATTSIQTQGCFSIGL